MRSLHCLNLTMLLAACGLLLAGCAREEKEEKKIASPSADVKKSAADASCPSCCTPLSRGALLGKAASDTKGCVELKVATLAQILDDVKSQPGKIVLMDIWGEFCLPCREEFPHLVKLHQKHGKDGLVCMSLAVDDIEQKDAVHAFLEEQGADFGNYILSPDSQDWQDHWDISAVPVVLVFRDGKLLRKFTNDDPDTQYTYADVETYLANLLK